MSAGLEELSLFDPGPSQTVSLNDRFVVPPFTLLDTRQGYWQERKRRWMALGIQSELGRGEDALGMSGSSGQAAAWHTSGDYEPSSRRAADERSNITGAPPLPEYANNGTAHIAPGTSIFDPVLCELTYRWFSAEGARILDPFAGGSVRGITASHLGRWYHGIELRPEQVAANRVQAERLTDSHPPVWIEGDATEADVVAEGEYDLVFTCPPYADLEVYSEDPRDLSTMTYPEFLDAYRQAIARSMSMLRPDRFAVIVVGDVRDKRGVYRSFVADTIHAFLDTGADLYNEAVLANPVGTAALRAPKQFDAGRKLVKVHQNVLVFVKGDPRRAAAYATRGAA